MIKYLQKGYLDSNEGFALMALRSFCKPWRMWVCFLSGTVCIWQKSSEQHSLVPSCLTWNDRKWCQQVQSSWSLLLFLTSAIWLHSLCVVHDQPAGHLYIYLSSQIPETPFKISRLWGLKSCSDFHEGVTLFPSSATERAVTAQKGCCLPVIKLRCKMEESKDCGEVALNMGETISHCCDLFMYLLELSLLYLYWKNRNCLDINLFLSVESLWILKVSRGSPSPSFQVFWRKQSFMLKREPLKPALCSHPGLSFSIHSKNFCSWGTPSRAQLHLTLVTMGIPWLPWHISQGIFQKL